jgi:hypothetical protein
MKVAVLVPLLAAVDPVTTWAGGPTRGAWPPRQ